MPETEIRQGATHADAEHRNALIARLRRIEGQVRGLQRMVEEDRYCPDILAQVASVQAALQGTAKRLMRGHLEHCVTDALRSGDPAEAARTYDEVIDLVYRNVK
jgi:CsoR family transcriptional regulator, copper-sensing transcriptional repressor